MRSRWLAGTTVFLLGTALSPSMPAFAQEEPSRVEMIKATQNPLTRNLASITASNEFSFGLGPADAFGYGLFLKPSVPIVLGESWSLINRATLPVFSVPSGPGGSRTAGLGDIQYSVLLSPTTTRKLVWGLGPAVQFPSATDDLLGSGKWSMGPAAIIVASLRRSVFGVLVQNLWSVAGNSANRDVNLLTMRLLANINLPKGWFISSKPNISADWEAPNDQRWLVAAGGGLGKVFRVGNIGISLEAEFFGYPVKPDGGPSWTARMDLKLLILRGALRRRVEERRE